MPNSQFPPATGNEANRPTLVSFYGGERYYYDCAELLRSDCETFGIANDIQEVKFAENTNWVDMCRHKVRFIRDMHEKHGGGILWLDVDSRILRNPTFLRSTGADFGALLRGLVYFRDFDPQLAARWFAPTMLYFGYSSTARAFLALVHQLCEESRVAATDDFFLQEAWQRFQGQLHLEIWPPGYVCFDGGDVPEQAYVLLKSSGNVSVYRPQAQQHSAPIATPARTVHVLRRVAAEARKRRDQAAVNVLENEILRVDATDQSTAANVALRLMRGNAAFGRAREILSRATLGRPLDGQVKRALCELEILEGNLDAAAELVRQFAQSEKLPERQFAKSRAYRIDLERRAIGIPPERRIRIWWMEHPFPGNFGDALNPYVVEKLAGIPPRMGPAGVSLLMIGSIVKFAAAGSTVWGAGTPRMTDVLAPDAKYLAVRGPLTRRLVLRSGGTCPDVFGDCAAFLPQLYRPKSSGKHALGLIRHGSHTAALAHADGVLEISVERVGDTDFEAFIDEVCSCERILSSSLHGLIVAHAYGIPAEWCTFAGMEASISQGDHTKFDDYFLSVGLKPRDPIVLAPHDVLDNAWARKVDTLPSSPIDLQRLADVAPFEISVPIKSPNLIAL